MCWRKLHLKGGGTKLWIEIEIIPIAKNERNRSQRNYWDIEYEKLPEEKTPKSMQKESKTTTHIGKGRETLRSTPRQEEKYFLSER